MKTEHHFDNHHINNEGHHSLIWTSTILSNNAHSTPMYWPTPAFQKVRNQKFLILNVAEFWSYHLFLYFYQLPLLNTVPFLAFLSSLSYCAFILLFTYLCKWLAFNAVLKSISLLWRWPSILSEGEGGAKSSPGGLVDLSTYGRERRKHELHS